MSIDNLSPDSLAPGQNYKVYVRAETINSQVLFEDEKAVEFNAKSLSIFVQTDKAIYKPGSTVFYRVIVVKPDLTPHAEPIDLRILDPSQNIITQSLDRPLAKGMSLSEGML